jgi:hypothetical protein
MKTGHYIFTLDANLCIMSVNHLHPEYDPEHVIGRPLTDFITPDCHRCFRNQAAEAELGRSVTACWQWDSPEGPACMLCTLAYVRDDNGNGFIGAAHRLVSAFGRKPCETVPSHQLF